MTRREFVVSSLGAAAFALGGPCLRAAAPGPRINAARLRADLEALSVFGRPANGTFADGVSRVGYSDADVAGRRFVMDAMGGAGLAPRVDAAGNILARRAGSNDTR